MIIRYFRCLALLGATSSLLNWDVVWGTDDYDLQKQGWVKVLISEELQSPRELEEPQENDSLDEGKGLKKRISQLEQYCSDSALRISQLEQYQSALNQLLSQMFQAFQVFQASQANSSLQATIGTTPILPRAGHELPLPPPPPSFKIPEISISLHTPTHQQAPRPKAVSKNAVPPKAIAGGVHTEMLAELKTVMLKKVPRLSHEDMKLLSEIHRAIEANEFISRFVVKSTLTSTKPQKEELFSALEAKIGSIRKDVEGSCEEDESWDDTEFCDSAPEEANEEGEEKLPSELEKFERITQVNRDALLDHNQKVQDATDKVVPMPLRGANKNEMLVWEWKFYSTSGQKKRINKIVRSYIKREKDRLELEYKDFNLNNVVLNTQRSMLTAPHPTSADSSLAISICSPGQHPFF